MWRKAITQAFTVLHTPSSPQPSDSCFWPFTLSYFLCHWTSIRPSYFILVCIHLKVSRAFGDKDSTPLITWILTESFISIFIGSVHYVSSIFSQASFFFVLLPPSPNNCCQLHSAEPTIEIFDRVSSFSNSIFIRFFGFVRPQLLFTPLVHFKVPGEDNFIILASDGLWDVLR